MSHFHRKRTNRKGVLTEDKAWTIEFVDHNNISRRVTASRDKTASMSLEHNLNRLVAFRASGAVPDPKLNQFIENLSPDMRDKLASWGIIEPERAASAKFLIEHLASWKNALEGKGNTSSHIKKSIAKIKKLMGDCHWKKLSDITAQSFDAWRVDAKAGGLSQQSINHYLTVAKTFCNWLVQNKCATENPLAYLKKKTVTDSDRRHMRRASDDNELEQLLASTFAGEKHHGMTGQARSLLYRFAIETGFRWSECGSLLKSSFNFTSKPPTVTVASGKSKNRKERTNPISEELAADLMEYMALFLPNAKAFQGMHKNRIGAKMLRMDLEAAGIPYQDECGQVRDFHSLRKTFGTRLARNGVPLAVAQILLDHTDPKLTANHYTMIVMDDKATAIAKLPTLTGRTAPQSESLAKTGTTDNHPFELPPLPLPVDRQGNVGNHACPTVKAGEISSDSCESVDRLGDRNAPSSDGFYWTYSNRASIGIQGDQKIQNSSKPLENGDVLGIIPHTDTQKPGWWNGIHAGFKNPWAQAREGSTPSPGTRITAEGLRFFV